MKPRTVGLLLLLAPLSWPILGWLVEHFAKEIEQWTFVRHPVAIVVGLFLVIYSYSTWYMIIANRVPWEKD